MSVLRSPQYRSASRGVLRWCEWYTRGLDRRTAEERRDEIASDLHDHAEWAMEAGVSPGRSRRQIIRRAVRGAPADLSWRWAQLKATAPHDLRSTAVRRVDNALVSAALLAGALVSGLGIFLLVRIVRALVIADVAEMPRLTPHVAICTAFALVATVLLVGARTRWLGALMLALASIALSVLAGRILWLVSATGSMLISQMSRYDAGPQPWEIVSLAAGLGATIGFAGAAIAWWPSRPQRDGGALHSSLPTEPTSPSDIKETS